MANYLSIQDVQDLEANNQQQEQQQQPPIEGQTVAKQTKLFAKSVDQFQIRAFFLLIERIYLIISMSIILWTLSTHSCSWDSLHYWVLFSLIQAIFAFGLYLQIYLLSCNQIIIDKLAEQYAQVVYVPIENASNDPVAPEALDPTFQLNDQEINKKSDILALQIRSEIVNANFFCKFNNYFSTLTNQLIFIWTMIYFIGSDFDSGDELQCSKWPLIQSYIYGVLLFVQYSHYYLLAAIIIVLMPFFLGFLVVKCFKDRKVKHQAALALRELKKHSLIKYQPNKVEGEQECTICMEPYKNGDDVLTLPCSTLHHFHDYCITVWLNVQSTCPNCRKPIFENGNQQPLLDEQQNNNND